MRTRSNGLYQFFSDHKGILERSKNRHAPPMEAKTPGDYLRWIKVQHGDGIRLLPIEEVCYFKAGDKYTMVMTQNGESLIRRSIKSLAEALDPNQFWRIHRGAIVNVGQIAKVSRSLTGHSMIKLKDLEETLSVSRTYAHLFRQM